MGGDCAVAASQDRITSTAAATGFDCLRS